MRERDLSSFRCVEKRREVLTRGNGVWLCGLMISRERHRARLVTERFTAFREKSCMHRKSRKRARETVDPPPRLCMRENYKTGEMCLL